jgi:2-isopropylmalate synthase
VLVSDLSGRSNVLYQLQQQGLAERMTGEARRELLERVKEMEFQGYDLEAADGTFELFVRQSLQPGVNFFEVESYEVNIKSGQATATVSVNTQDGIHTATATGHGPVNALDVSLRKCISALYPRIGDVRLTDYKVRVLDSKKGTAAKVRVLVEWSDHQKSWQTVGVSDDVIEASWNALVDALRLELMRLTETNAGASQPVEVRR